MKLAVVALALAASCALLAPPVLAASLEKGTLELEGSVGLDHTSYSAGSVNSVTNLDGSLGAAWSLSRPLQVGGGVLFGNHSSDSDAGTFSYSSYGVTGDLTWNFATPNNLIPFLRAGVGLEGFSGDGFEGAKTAFIAPYARGGVRVLVGNSASVNLSVAYQHILNADGSSSVDANVVAFTAGLSIFPIRGH